MKTGVAASWRQPGGLIRFAATFFHRRKIPKDLPKEQIDGRARPQPRTPPAAFLTAGRCVCPCQPMLTSTRKARGISDAGIALRSRRRVKRVIGSASCGELLFAARERVRYRPCRLSQEIRYSLRRYLGQQARSVVLPYKKAAGTCPAAFSL